MKVIEKLTTDLELAMQSIEDAGNFLRLEVDRACDRLEREQVEV